jgi:hypothetical protein
MADLVRPFECLWEWIDRTGGYPGKLMFAGMIVMLMIGVLSWYSGRR